MKFKLRRKRQRASDGKSTSQGFWAKTVRLSLIMFPHEGVGGFTESPKKANAPSKVTTDAMPISKNETMIGVIFGKISLRRIRKLLAPCTFAAVTKSLVATDSDAARTTR
jgi:hypothetical protein